MISIRLGRQQRRKAINRSTSAKELVGFSLMEYEYDIGHIFTRIVCPWSTGVRCLIYDVYDISLGPFLPTGRFRCIQSHDRGRPGTSVADSELARC